VKAIISGNKWKEKGNRYLFGEQSKKGTENKNFYKKGTENMNFCFLCKNAALKCLGASRKNFQEFPETGLPDFS
jgi:hypothetical protein